MECEKGMTGHSGRQGIASTLLFVSGAVLMLIEALGYMLNVDSGGKLFVSGFFLLLLGALISAFSDREKPKTEDVLTVLAGLCFFGWIGWKTFIQ